MTAMNNRGLALLPLALAADKPGSEIQAPMSIVLLGGLITATFLTLIVVPVLFSKWGRADSQEHALRHQPGEPE